MNTKLLSKEVVKGFIMREFNNDPRITDELLFDGKRMTMECYVLLKDIMPRRGYYSGNILDDLGYHCYLSFDVPLCRAYSCSKYSAVSGSAKRNRGQHRFLFYSLRTIIASS